MYFLNYLNAFTFIYTYFMKILSRTLTFVSLLSFSNFFALTHPVEAFVPMIHSSSSHVIQSPTSSLSQLKTFMPFYELSHYESLNHFSEKANHLGDEVGKNIVLSVSAGLPKFDTVGHKILSANHDFIYDVLHNDHLSHAMKKDIILASIKLAQMGDDIGSHILQQYYNLVESCL